MSTRIIVHPASDDTADDRWHAYIQGHPDPFRLVSFGALNEAISELGIADGDYYGAAVACDEPGCALAAVGTVIWSRPDVYHVARLCGEHQQETVRAAVQADYPNAVIDGLVAVSQAFYSRMSRQDTASLTRALVAYELPAEVFAQPACTQCQEAVCPARDGSGWVNAEGSGDCQKSDSGHIVETVPAGPGEDDAKLTGMPVATPAG